MVCVGVIQNIKFQTILVCDLKSMKSMNERKWLMDKPL